MKASKTVREFLKSYRRRKASKAVVSQAEYYALVREAQEDTGDADIASAWVAIGHRLERTIAA